MSLWRVKEFNGFALDDASYYAYLTDDDNPTILPTRVLNALKRGRQAPVYSGESRETDQLVMTVKIKAANVRTAHQNLIGALSVSDVKQLVCTDQAGNEWHVYARPINAMRDTSERTNSIRVPMLVPDRIWRRLASEVTWNVSTSGETQNVTNDGNLPTYPVFVFKPRAMKATGFSYRYWVPIINPSSVRAFADDPLDLTDGGLDTTGWVADASISNQLNGAVTAGAASIPIDTPVGGGLPSQGMAMLDDGVNESQIAWTGMTGTPTSGTLTGVTWEVGGTSAHNFADNTVLKLSYMQADAADVRIHVDGLDQDVWVRSPNDAATGIWINHSQGAGIALTIKNDISTGALTEIEFAFTVDNVSAMNRLPSSGVLKINNEAFSFWSIDKLKRKAYIEARSINDTVEDSHSAGDTAHFIERDCWLYCGNPYLSARENDETRKPILDMDNSDNVTRVYVEFWDRDNLRTGAWKPVVSSASYPELRSTRYYTGNQNDESPSVATEMGMRMISQYWDGRWNFENGKVGWVLYDPAGVDDVTQWVYEKYRLGTSWPLTARLAKSKDGQLYVAVSAVSTPASSASWGSPVTVGPFSMGDGYYFLQTQFEGSITGGNSGGAGYEAALETNSLTYTRISPMVPTIMARGINSYEIDGRMTNNANDLYFDLKRTLPLDGEIEVDCSAEIVTTLADGLRRRSALYLPDEQLNWMEFLAGVNQLEYVEEGVTSMDITIRYYHMLAV